MKKYKKKSIFAIALSVLALAGCSDEFSGIPNETTEESSGSTITVEEAMNYFDDHIKTFYLSPQGKTRRADEELLAAPEWEDGKAFRYKGKNIVEVPVYAPNTIITHIESPLDSVPQENKTHSNTHYNLVAEKQSDGNILFTLAKITCEDSYLLKRKRRKNTFKVGYRNFKGFSGDIRSYTLNGEFLIGKRYKDGKTIATISSNQIYDVNNPMQVSEKQTRSLEYQCWTEYIWVDEYRCYNTEWGMEMGEEENCEWVGGHAEEEYVCDYVEVNDACGVCHNDPCTCDQDNDKDDSTGEWGDNDNPKDDTSFKEAKELMDKSKFVPWYAGANCMELCNSILTNYGQPNPGDSGHVFQLSKETSFSNPRLSFGYPDPVPVYKNAIKCIDEHLNKGNVIIAGVDYKSDKDKKKGEGNPDGTDHFVVITGRGYDSTRKQYYYTYMDCGTSKAESGCDTQKNRFYYDSSIPSFEGKNEVLGKDYSVTHVRPNDGISRDTSPVHDSKPKN